MSVYLQTISSAENNQWTDDCLINTRLELAKCRERLQFAENEPDCVKRLDSLIYIWDILGRFGQGETTLVWVWYINHTPVFNLLCVMQGTFCSKK